MNYLTSILAVPLFTLVLLFEFWLVFRPGATRIENTLTRRTTYAFLVISVLQCISCYFWLFGFSLGKLNSIFSEGHEPNEEVNCFGLVGAEVLLSIYQLLMTLGGIYHSFVIWNVQTGSIKSAEGYKDWSKFLKWTFFGSTGVLFIYTIFAWITAWNRRCPKGVRILLGFQHHFYPVYLTIDGFVYLITLIKLYQIGQEWQKVKTALTTQKAGGASSVPFDRSGAGQSGSNVKNVSQKQLKTGTQTTTDTADEQARSGTGDNSRFQNMIHQFTKSMYITVATSIVSCIIFFLQFVSQIPEFSIIAC
ncbi:hypothetical protein BKA69DRAFT_1165368, partial [Paraphysoderma sedebokerense]